MSSSIILFLGIGGGELLVIFLFVLLFFGAESIPTMARTFGKIYYQIKNATSDIQRDIRQSANNIKNEMSQNISIEDPIKDIKKEIDDTFKSIDND